MNVKIFCLLVGAALAWTPTVAAADLPPTKEETPQENPGSDRLGPPYIENRWIGLLEKGSSPCPTASGWEVQKSLSSPTRPYAGQSAEYQPDQDELAHALGLDRFCVYTRESHSPRKPFPKSLPGLVKAEPDRIVVVPLAPLAEDRGCSSDDLGQRIRPNLEEHFLQQVGQVRLAPSQPSVRLVFVDTQETSDGLPREAGRSCHGYAMAHLAYRLVCGGGEHCPITIATRLALRYDSPDPDSASPRGGSLGSLLELAEAIKEEVRKWQQDKTKTKLILNLSIGWDGELLSEMTACESQMGPLALAVYNAIRYAAGRGALVIAAAGNRRGGTPHTSSPVLPAAWEIRHPADWLLGHKAIYAVGGLDWQGMPISNSRHGGMPQRAAYADHVAVRTRSPLSTEWTSIYTGTSVSAAVVSSVAAAVWYLQPALRPFEVMEWIEGFSETLPLQAEFYNGLTQPQVRRVSLCRPVKETCLLAGSNCDSLVDLSCSGGDQPPPDLSSLPEQSIPVEATPDQFSPCNARTWRLRRPANPGPTRQPSALCPMELLPDLNTPAAGWTGPQPGDNPCPSCTILPDPPRTTTTRTDFTTYSLAMETSPLFASMIESAVLVIDCETNRFSMELKSSTDPVLSRSTRIPLGLSFTPRNCTSSVDWAVTRGGESRTVQSPVKIYP